VSKLRLNFHEYPQEIERARGGTAFSHAKILDEINDLRTPLKHRGTLPNPDAVRALAEKIEFVFEDNARKFLNISWQDVSLADIVQNPDVRNEVKDAEAAIAAGRYTDALASLRVALDTLLSRVKQQVPVHAKVWTDLPKELFDDSDIRRVGLNPDLNDVGRALAHANQKYEKVFYTLELLSMGVDISEYARFNYVAPSVQKTGSGKRYVVSPHLSTILQTKDVARFCLNFVLDAATRLEGRFHVRDLWSTFKIRLVRESPYFTLNNHIRTELGTLPQGHEIDDAKPHFVIGEGECWSWGTDDKRKFVQIDSCEIVSEIVHGLRRPHELNEHE
jgi:hypothetical protein